MENPSGFVVPPLPCHSTLTRMPAICRWEMTWPRAAGFQQHQGDVVLGFGVALLGPLNDADVFGGEGDGEVVEDQVDLDLGRAWFSTPPPALRVCGAVCRDRRRQRVRLVRPVSWAAVSMEMVGMGWLGCFWWEGDECIRGGRGWVVVTKNGDRGWGVREK